MSVKKARYNIEYDLENCAAEPLRFIRSCQQHAYLLVCKLPNLRLKAFSENCHDRFPVADGLRTGMNLRELLPAETLESVQAMVAADNYKVNNPIILRQPDRQGDVRKENLIIHRSGEVLILEFEERHDSVNQAGFLQQVDHTLQQIQGATETQQMLEVTVREVKKLTGYDRVWLYEFDAEYNGTVIAEAVEPEMQSYLHLRYPHTDIPEQARQLYLKQQIRQIVNTAENSDALLISEDDEPIDLGYAVNRAVSPIHLEYMRNMGVGATMSIAITVGGKLWGLLACHHRTPKLVDYRLRTMLGFFSRVISGHIGLERSVSDKMAVLQTNLIRSRLMERMNENLNVEEVLSEEEDLLQLTTATGAVMVLNGESHFLGQCPREEELEPLLTFLNKQQENVFHTNRLFDVLPAAKGFANAPAGLIAARLSVAPAEYILWFRPEVIETVAWGGRPDARKVIENGRVRLHPELSFARWEEAVAGMSEPWASHHVEVVKELRNDIKEVILLRFQEIRSLNKRLVAAYNELESFSYTVSHDLRAPLRSIKGYAEILQEDFNGKLDVEGGRVLNTIIANVGKMNQFINDILDFSRLGRLKLMVGEVSLLQVINEIWQDIKFSGSDPVKLELDLQTDMVPFDYTMLGQVMTNLIANAVKYSRDIDDRWIKVSSTTEEGQVIIQVADNGIGFEMKYADRIFEVFNRLVSEDQYEGTGIGLAVVKRIIKKHRGTISVSSLPEEGTVFTIKIPADLAEQLGTEIGN